MTNYASSLALTAVTNHSIALDVPFPVMKGQRVFYSAVLLWRVLKATAKGEWPPLIQEISNFTAFITIIENVGPSIGTLYYMYYDHSLPIIGV